MKHNISSAEAATLLVIVEIMISISRTSPVIATLIGIDRHELNKAKALIKRIGNNEKNEYYGKGKTKVERRRMECTGKHHQGRSKAKTRESQ